MAEGTTEGGVLSNSAETGRQKQSPLQKVRGLFRPQETPFSQPNPMSVETKEGNLQPDTAPKPPIAQAAEAAISKATEPRQHLWYHYTSPENAASIKATGLQGNAYGSLGPGVYISDKPIELATPGRFEILTLQLQEETNILDVSWEQNTNPHKTITGLYGKDGAKLLREEERISRANSKNGWVYLQGLAKAKGYDGFSWTNPMSGIKEVVIFDPKKLSLAESPAPATGTTA